MIIAVFIIGLFFLLYLIGGKFRLLTGEETIANKLKKLPSDQYITFNDITLKYGNNTCQIDHVVLSLYGVFVIENKDYGGTIFGKEDDVEWKQTLVHYRNRNGDTVDRYYFHNPIKQNYWHVKCLKYLLGENITIFSVITFSKAASLQVNTTTPVLYYNELNGFILSQQHKCLTEAQFNTILQKLQSNIISDPALKAQHIIQAKQAHINQSEKIQNGICPKCGGKLVVRKGNYGSFWGCTNYPKCKYTRDFLYE